MHAILGRTFMSSVSDGTDFSVNIEVARDRQPPKFGGQVFPSHIPSIVLVSNPERGMPRRYSNHCSTFHLHNISTWRGQLLNLMHTHC